MFSPLFPRVYFRAALDVLLCTSCALSQKEKTKREKFFPFFFPFFFLQFSHLNSPRSVFVTTPPRRAERMRAKWKKKRQVSHKGKKKRKKRLFFLIIEKNPHFFAHSAR
jgi:hypothetical protein